MYNQWNESNSIILISFNRCKKENVPICNPDIFAFHTLGVKCYFHPLNNHVKAVQHTFTVTHGPDTKAHNFE